MRAMSQIKDEVILRPRKSSALLYLMLCAAFTAGGIWMIANDKPAGWSVSSFFGLGVVVFIVNLPPSSSYLLLKKEGFTVCSLYRKSSFKWSDIEEFVVGYLIGPKMVVFNFSLTYDRQQKSRIISKAIAGYEGALPDTYGMSAKELAELLNNWKVGIRQSG
jgi:hypothetical protein